MAGLVGTRQSRTISVFGVNLKGRDKTLHL